MSFVYRDTSERAIRAREEAVASGLCPGCRHNAVKPPRIISDGSDWLCSKCAEEAEAVGEL